MILSSGIKMRNLLSIKSHYKQSEKNKRWEKAIATSIKDSRLVIRNKLKHWGTVLRCISDWQKLKNSAIAKADEYTKQQKHSCIASTSLNC